jgi:hypothetical protein
VQGASVTVTAGGTATQTFTIAKSTTQLVAVAVAVTGSRGGERTVVASPVPVDVINTADLKSSGRVETAQMLQALAPSFNFPRPTTASSGGTAAAGPPSRRWGRSCSPASRRWTPPAR